MNHPKFVQIVSSDGELFALDELGEVWKSKTRYQSGPGTEWLEVLFMRKVPREGEKDETKRS